MRTILILDHEVKAALTLAKALAAETGWAVHAKSSVLETLTFLQKHPTDAVVCDLRVPPGGAPLLLSEILQRHPSVHRFVLGDLNDKQTLLRCIGTAHQFIAKPCDSSRLRNALERAFQFDLWLPDASVQKLMGQLKKLPSPPDLFFKLVQLLRSPDASLEAVSQIVARDLATTAKLLQLVNSTLFGLSEPISNPFEAVTHLGLETTKSMVLLAHCFSYFEKTKASDFSAESLWSHSLAVGQIARAIARAEKADREVGDACYTAGILHDLGKLALAANLPDDFGRAVTLARTRAIPTVQAEAEVFGASHAEVGACLLALWGLPPEIVEALAFHHRPTRFLGKGFCPLTAVHVANALCHHRATGEPLSWDVSYLTELDLADRLESWQDLVEEKAHAAAQTHAA